MIERKLKDSNTETYWRYSDGKEFVIDKIGLKKTPNEFRKGQSGLGDVSFKWYYSNQETPDCLSYFTPSIVDLTKHQKK